MREFYIDDDGIRLHAKLEMPIERPEAEQRCPLAIIFHGLTGNMEENHLLGIAQALREVGVATLRVDLYGHGLSDGSFAEHTLYKWIGNALAVIDYARGLDFATELYLCGHSQGGLLTILVAGMRPDDFRAILPLAPACVIVDGARSGHMLGMDFDPNRIPNELQVKGISLNGNYLRVAQTLNVEAAIDRYAGPVLLVHGTQDMAVPYHYSVDAQKRYANARLVTLEGDDHGFHQHLDQAARAVKEFIRSL